MAQKLRRSSFEFGPVNRFNAAINATNFDIGTRPKAIRYVLQRHFIVSIIRIFIFFPKGSPSSSAFRGMSAR